MKNRRAFTLVELLVVIGILVLLAGLLMPMLTRAYRSSTKAKLTADIQTISTGLIAYHQDFGTYPTVVTPNTGFAVLGKALVAPGYCTATFDGGGAPPVVSIGSKTHVSPWAIGEIAVAGSTEYVCITDTTSGPPGVDWAIFPTVDGAGSDNTKEAGTRAAPDPSDNGFRTRGIAGTTDRQGRVYGPYISVDKFKMRGMAILDSNGTAPLLYFPVASNTINPNDNLTPFGSTGGLDKVRAMIGDVNLNGTFDTGETPIPTKNYILWCAGADGIFGPTPALTLTDVPANKIAAEKCDDVIVTGN